MAHTRTGWQFEKLRIMPDVMEMGDRKLQEQRGHDSANSDWITENPNFAAENFTSDRPTTQPALTSGFLSNNILNDLPSHQLEDVLDTDDSKNVVVRLRDNAASKKKRLATLRMRKAVMSQARDNIDQTDVIDVLARDPELNQQSPESEQLRMEAIRDLHYSLSMKRSLKRQMSQVVVRKPMQRPRFSALVRFKLKQGFRSLKTKLNEGLRKVDFWRAHIRMVEGRFGSSTAYYFRFLQQLVALNLLIFAISCTFILMPHVVWAPKNETIANIREFSWSDILTGSGYFQNTELYYGAYINRNFTVVDDFTYNLSLAYLLSTASHLLLCLFLLASWVADSYKKYLAANSSYGAHTFCNLVFCSWDFTIVSHEACSLKRMGILHDMQEKVRKYNSKTNSMNCSAKCNKCTKQFLNHVVAFATMFVCGYLTWYLQQNTSKNNQLVLKEMILPLVITGIFIILPVAYSIIVTWEGYHARSTEVYTTLVRMMLLLMTVLGVLCYFWFGKKDKNNTDCWETKLGEEVYRLLLVDFFVSTLLYLLFSFLQRCVQFPNLLGNSEFNLAWNTWNLIYTQMLCWLGSFYSPLISGIVLVKLILTFYLKQLHVRLNCTPPAKPWGASQAKTVFLLITFLGLIATLFLVGYSIIGMTPSSTCGPFNGMATAYDVVIDALKDFHNTKQLLGLVMDFVTRPGCVAGLIVILSAIAFQARAFAKTNKDMVTRLQEQLILEGTDKNFLLQMVDKATRLQPKGADDVPCSPSSATQLPSNRRPIRPAGLVSSPSPATNGGMPPTSYLQGPYKSSNEPTSTRNAYESLHRDGARLDNQQRRSSTVNEERSASTNRFDGIDFHSQFK